MAENFFFPPDPEETNQLKLFPSTIEVKLRLFLILMTKQTGTNANRPTQAWFEGNNIFSNPSRSNPSKVRAKREQKD